MQRHLWLKLFWIVLAIWTTGRTGIDNGNWPAASSKNLKL